MQIILNQWVHVVVLANELLKTFHVKDRISQSFFMVKRMTFKNDQKCRLKVLLLTISSTGSIQQTPQHTCSWKFVKMFRRATCTCKERNKIIEQSVLRFLWEMIMTPSYIHYYCLTFTEVKLFTIKNICIAVAIRLNMI